MELLNTTKFPSQLPHLIVKDAITSGIKRVRFFFFCKKWRIFIFKLRWANRLSECYFIASSYPSWKCILQDALGKFKKAEKAKNVSCKFYVDFFSRGNLSKTNLSKASVLFCWFTTIYRGT